MNVIIPTCVPKTSDDLSIAAEKFRPFAQEIHLDINDGIFASPRTWPYAEDGFGEIDLSTLAGFEVGVHLMVADPLAIGEAFARAGAVRVTAHRETFASAERFQEAAAAWRSAGAGEIGVAFLLGTPTTLLGEVVAYADFIHLMSITTIGEQGASFSPTSLARIKEVRERYPAMPIEVDGGISEANISLVARAGATRFAVGSAIMHAHDASFTYAQLATAAQSVIQ